MKFKCKVCGYVYDTEIGDPSQNILENTAFEDLPSSWKCPVCDAPVDDFMEIE